MTKTKNIELIEKYLDHEMDPKELADFKARLLKDPELAKELQLHTELLEAIKDTGKINLRHTLDQVHHNSTNIWLLPAFTARIRTIAAILIIVLVAGGVLITNYFTTGVSDQQLYSQYFNPEDALLTVRSMEAEISAIEEGIKLYQAGNYEEAVKAFSSKPHDLLGKLYSGFSLMHLEEFDQARVYFNEIIEDNDNLLLDQAEWHLGLCLMMSGEEDEAAVVFEKISKGNTVYNKKALELLTKMGKI
jgi:tetratricopeptide (TPR) repeat protein